MAYNTLSTPTKKPLGQRMANASTRSALQNLSPARADAFRRYVAGATAQRAPMAPGGNGIPAFVLPGSAEAEYQIGRQEANETYNEGIATNQFQREQAQQAFAPQFRDLALQYGRLREALPGQAIARGVFGTKGSSGIWNRQLSDYATDRMNARGDLELEQSQRLAGFDFAKSMLARRRALALANLGLRHAGNLGSAAAASLG